MKSALIECVQADTAIVRIQLKEFINRINTATHTYNSNFQQTRIATLFDDQIEHREIVNKT